MSRHEILGLALMGGLTIMAAAPATAQDGYPYLGLGVGRSLLHVDVAAVAQRHLGAGLTPATVARDDKDSAYKLFGGWRFNRNFALELGYFDLGSFGLTVTTVPQGAFASTLSGRGANLDLVATLPLSTHWSLLGRGGIQSIRTRHTFSGSSGADAVNANDSRREANAKLGLGLQYAFDGGFMLRAEVERLHVRDASGVSERVAVVSLSLLFTLGRGGDAQPRSASRRSHE